MREMALFIANDDEHDSIWRELRVGVTGQPPVNKERKIQKERKRSVENRGL